MIDAAQMTSRIDARLLELKNSSHIKGFRPGKVPMELFRRMYGDGVVQDVLKSTIEEKLERRTFGTADPPGDAGNDPGCLILAGARISSTFWPSRSCPTSRPSIIRVSFFPPLSLKSAKRISMKPSMCWRVLPAHRDVLDDATGVMLNDRITVDIEVLVDGERNDDFSVTNQDIDTD